MKKMKERFFLEIEKKWQKFWEENKIFEFPENPQRKMYVLEMYPYPSGDLHMGQCRNYVIGDCVARKKMMDGYNVLHPFGWDAFGLPAENSAIKRKIHPREWTIKNIENSRKDIKSMGISYDWRTELLTCEPEYYKWTQWIFLLLLKRNLAYRKKAYVNFCPSCQTVLANEQIIGSVCERCKTEVTKKELVQWFFKITEYAEILLQDLKLLEGKWPKRVIEMQRNWIGKSEGVLIHFPFENEEKFLSVFTTRADTLYGVTFLTLAPEHEISKKISEKNKEVSLYIEKALKMSEIERASTEREKTGVFTGLYALHPLTKEKLPVFVGDYVLAHYGTGIVMGVPAHDQRDFEFAKKMKLPIKIVIQPKNGEKLNLKTMHRAFEDYGIMTNSALFNGLPSEQGIKEIAKYLKERRLGEETVTYRLRDWLISRQRYWGAPIPVIHCERCGIVPVSENELPVILPLIVDYLPKGKSPLESSSEFINTTCPCCKSPAKRDPDTMDTFVDSSWYFLRYPDAKNKHEIFNKKNIEKWLPVDHYIGGAEHATGHLLYARFINKVLYDEGLIPFKEPFERLFAQGMVLRRTETGELEMMSKRAGNAIAIRDFIEEWGADVARINILFAAPPEKDFEWTGEGVLGAKRFLTRVYRIFQENIEIYKNSPYRIKVKTLDAECLELYRISNKFFEKIFQDIDDYHFNTAVAALMEWLNALYEFKQKRTEVLGQCLYLYVFCLAPFAPHIAEELWNIRNSKESSIFKQRIPQVDKEVIEKGAVTLIVQINGKVRAKLRVRKSISEEEAKKIAFEMANVQKYVHGKKIEKIYYVQDKILSLVVK